MKNRKIYLLYMSIFCKMYNIYKYINKHNTIICSIKLCYHTNRGIPVSSLMMNSYFYITLEYYCLTKKSMLPFLPMINLIILC